MKRLLVPVIAGVTMVSLAVAQQTTTTTERKANVEVHRFEMMCAPGSYLGVMPADVTTEKAKELNMADTYGALLTDVVDSSPARTAGLQKNDVIVSWNGTRVEGAAQLRRLVNETPAGRTVHIGFIRSGAKQEIDAKIGNRPSPFAGMNMPQMPFGMGQNGQMTLISPDAGQIFMSAGDPRTGMTLQSMTPQLSKYFGVSEGNGTLIGTVAENSSAAKAGLQAGDVVTAIDGNKIQSPMDAHKIIAEKKEGTVQVTVIRDKQERTFTVTLEGKPMDFNLNFPDLKGLDKLGGRMEIFETQGGNDNEIENEIENGGSEGNNVIVAPPDGSANSELSDAHSATHPRVQVRTRVRVLPAPSENAANEAPPAGL